jgi:hypothetical protein
MSEPITVGEPYRDSEGEWSALMVLRSGAGYYIGRTFTGHGTGWMEPGTRESDYFRTSREAEDAMLAGECIRDCPENSMFYGLGSGELQ